MVSLRDLLAFWTFVSRVSRVIEVKNVNLHNPGSMNHVQDFIFLKLSTIFFQLC